MMLDVVDVAPVGQLSDFLSTTHAQDAGSVEISNWWHTYSYKYNTNIQYTDKVGSPVHRNVFYFLMFGSCTNIPDSTRLPELLELL